MHPAHRIVQSSSLQDRTNPTRINSKPLHIKPSERKCISPIRSGIDLGNTNVKPNRRDNMIQEEGLKLMMVDEGSDQKIRSRFISNWFKIESYFSNKGMLISQIEMIDPDVVLIDLDVYDLIGGIEMMNMIRDRFEVNTWYE
jgi:hypothetical protein